MAASTEIKGSRETRNNGKQKFTTLIYISDNGTTDIPAPGTLVLGDSGLLDRRCAEVSVKPEEPAPGMYLVVCQCVSFIAYA